MTYSVISTKPLESPWQGLDPFLFAVHHVDNYPAGDGRLGIKPEDRAKEGQGWRMYHGDHVPGFPAHPHRGFETVSIVLKGYVDHADSLGGAARYGQGDVQWLTTGGGVEHGEMFPLVNTDKPNTMEMFQIWLNLPPEGKSAEPAFGMFWAEDIPLVEKDGAKVTVIAGPFGDVRPLSPPKDSWAADPSHELAIWLIDIDKGGSLTLPTASMEALRRAYIYGGTATFDGQVQPQSHLVNLDASRVTTIRNDGDQRVRILLLQSKPIEAPVVARGPFVLNTAEEMIQTVTRYQSEGFGRWPWPTRAHTHGDEGRFIKYPDGRRETPAKATAD